ncbi:ER membrane protein complex subunit 8/9 homolog [Convolutriloba macropyga]|uniref:ER membrane protein complex subunit 8/9 homolog n=1 Tax=Convolutriloba macropyga TaxID=536237 RepID=UPI003F528693
MFELSLEATAKMFLHAAKHPCSPVNGLLLSLEGNRQCIVDAIPLFHCNLALQPMAEAALYMVDHYCQQTVASDGSRLTIAGYYFAPEMKHHKVDPNKGNVLGLRMGEKIVENSGVGGCVVILNNDQPVSTAAESLQHTSFRLYTNSVGESDWTLVKPGDIECGCSSVGTEAAIAIGAMMSSRLQHQITDMDEHLSDIQAHPDWTNQALNQLISQT